MAEHALRWKKVKTGVYAATSPWGLYTIDGTGYGRNRWTVTYPDGDYGMVDALTEAKAWAELHAEERARRGSQPTAARSVRKRSHSSHSTKRDPKEQFVELLMQRTDEARQIARDILLKHGVIKTGRVDSVRPVGGVVPIFQVDVVMHVGGRLGEYDPKRFWMAGPDAPAIGSAIDFTVTDEYPPTGKTTFAPKRQLHPVNRFLAADFPEFAIRNWIAKWWR